MPVSFSLAMCCKNVRNTIVTLSSNILEYSHAFNAEDFLMTVQGCYC